MNTQTISWISKTTILYLQLVGGVNWYGLRYNFPCGLISRIYLIIFALFKLADIFPNCRVLSRLTFHQLSQETLSGPRQFGHLWEVLMTTNISYLDQINSLVDNIYLFRYDYQDLVSHNSLVKTSLNTQLDNVWGDQSLQWSSCPNCISVCNERPPCSGRLTRWGRVTHVCVGNLAIIVSENGLSPARWQAITWANAGILLIGPFGTEFNENVFVNHTFHSSKCISKGRLQNGDHFVSASMC